MSMLTKVIVMGLVVMNFASVAQDESEESKEPDRFDKARPSWSSGLPERKKMTPTPNASLKPEIENEIEIDVSEFGLTEDINIAELPEPAVEAEEAVEEAPAVEEVNEAEVVEIPVETTPEPEPVVETPVETEVEEPAESVATISAPVEEAPVEEIPAEIEQEQPTEVADTAEEVIEVESQPSTEMVSIEDNAITSSEPNDNTIEQGLESDYRWRLIDRVSPEYPRQAARDQLEGWVDVEVTIGANGEVVNANVKKTSRKGNVFSRSALTAVRKWRFQQPTAEQLSNSELKKTYRLDFTF